MSGEGCFWASSRVINGSDGMDQDCGGLRMNYNVFWACCRGGSDCYMARCRVEMKVGRILMEMRIAA
jgi:hypothetical protein